VSDRIVGAHLVGHAGEELINFFALGIPSMVRVAAN
jgi:pyruvate/2-oxoglutarate dehydrogenase complex dihydrolipoamide dehydrogenase (E3) component